MTPHWAELAPFWVFSLELPEQDGELRVIAIDVDCALNFANDPSKDTGAACTEMEIEGRFSHAHVRAAPGYELQDEPGGVAQRVTQTYTATRSIGIGEEITMCYGPGFFAVRSEKQQRERARKAALSASQDAAVATRAKAEAVERGRARAEAATAQHEAWKLKISKVNLKQPLHVFDKRYRRGRGKEGGARRACRRSRPGPDSRAAATRSPPLALHSGRRTR